MKKSTQEIVRRTRGRDTALDARMNARHGTDAAAAVGDLFDLRRLMGDTLEAAGWDGIALLGEWAATDAGDAAVTLLVLVGIADCMRWRTREASINGGKAANDGAIREWRDVA